MSGEKPTTDLLTCQCAISYHVVHFEDDTMRHMLDKDEELPRIIQMCLDRCQQYGLPYHTEFTSEEIA